VPGPIDEVIAPNDLARFGNDVRKSLKQEYYSKERTHSYVKDNNETLDIGPCMSEFKHNIYDIY